MNRGLSMENIGPFGSTYRTPCSSRHTLTPRKSSTALGKGGLLYGSQENICPSYLSSYNAATTNTRGLRAPSLPRENQIDLSLVYCRPEPLAKPRSRRCVSEDREEVGIGWRGTGGRSMHSSRSSLADDAFRFLPPSAVNQTQPPVFLIKKSPGSTAAERMKNEVDENGDVDGADGKGVQKKRSTVLSAEERSRREDQVRELVKHLDNILHILNKVQEEAEKLLQRQAESEDFQKQMKKETEGYDLQRGVYRIIEALDGDRRELARLQKKAVEMRRRQLNGVELVGEEDELRGLLVGAADLERKLLKALEEIARISEKTDKLIKRQQDIDEQRKLKILEEAQRNEALQLLVQDLQMLDLLLKDLTEIRKQYMQAESIHRGIQKIIGKDELDEMDTDEMILETIRVDTQSITDDILRTREEIHKVQDCYLKDTDENLDVVSQQLCFKNKIKQTGVQVKQLENDMEEYIKNQNNRYMDLLAKKAAKDEEEKKKHEKEKLLKEELEKKRIQLEKQKKLEEEEERNKSELQRLKKEAEEKEKIKAEMEEQQRLKDLEEKRKKKEMDEKMMHLQKMLNEEAEKNMKNQRQEILNILDGETTEIERMKDQVLILVDKQKKIDHLRKKRRILYTIPEEVEIDEEQELRKLIERTSLLLNFLLDNEREVTKLKKELEASIPSEILQNVVHIEKELRSGADNLHAIADETERCHDKHAKRLEDCYRSQEEAEAGRRDLENSENKVKQMKEDVDLLKFKQNQLKKSLILDKSKDERNQDDLDLLAAEEEDLKSLEKDLFETSKELEEWESFTWPPELETEMNKYGMIGSSAIPAFPEFILQNPALRAAIEARKEELRRMKERVAAEELRLREIAKVLEIIERRRKEAELRRLAEQALEWTKDYIPMRSAEFGAMPVFRSDFTIDPDQARATAAFRRSSRVQSCEASVLPIEELGNMLGYEDILQGYGARSRNQSVDRASQQTSVSELRRERRTGVEPNLMKIDVLDLQDDPTEANTNQGEEKRPAENQAEEKGRGEDPEMERGRRKYKKSTPFQIHEHTVEQPEAITGPTTGPHPPRQPEETGALQTLDTHSLKPPAVPKRHKK